jgi:VanZ family protein
MPWLIQRLSQSPRLWVIALAGYWLALFTATHLPLETPGLPGPGMDKLVHVAAFAALAAIFGVTWRLVLGRIEWRHVLAIWLIIAVYAALDEWTQDWVGRHASVQDWAADVVGAAVALAGVRCWLLCFGTTPKSRKGR